MASPPKGSLREVLADPAVRVAIGVTIVVMIGFGIISPVLPLYARSFGVGRTEVGVMNMTFAICRLLMDLVAGPLADRYGERRLATLGTAVVGLSSIGMALSPTFGFLLVFRGIAGAGSSLLFAALMSYLIHSVAPERMGRAISAFFASFLVGMVLGQPVGGLIAEFLGLEAPLWVYAGACFASALITWRFLADARRSSHDHPAVGTAHEVLGAAEAPVSATWGRARELLRDRRFVLALFANAVLLWVMGAVRLTLAPLFARDAIGLSEGGIGLVLGATALGQLAVIAPAGRLADGRGRKSVLIPGALGLAVAVALIGVARAPLALAGVLALLGVATGFAGVAPAAMVADVAPSEVRGTAVGMFRFSGDLGMVVGPLVGGLVADAAGYLTTFIVMAVPALLVVAFSLRTAETLEAPALAGAR